MKQFKYTLLFSIFSGFGLIDNVLAGDSLVEYPVGYRDWVHVKSMIIQKGHGLYDSFGGIHHIYANTEALKGYKSGDFPDGAVLIFDLLEATQVDNAITEGPRKVLGVMVKNKDRFKATGGWGFEGFTEGDASRRAVGKKCKYSMFSVSYSPKRPRLCF